MTTAGDVIPMLYSTGIGNISFTCQKGYNHPFALSSVEVHFSGGTGSASLTIARDAFMGSHYDTTLFTLEEAGTDGSDVNFFVPEEEIERRYIFDAVVDKDGRYIDVDKLKIAWTNPDNGNMRWSLIVGLAHG